ncbi:MAG TPA: forkhead-associated protein, partial [Bacteroidota bacterium]|nr:forkhead-associated protein [Bacteroidota bacterium]
TDAQASGLLVMACYNWDETKIHEMLNSMPENPRQRNFWSLLARHTLPEETYDYVFYIISAAVIGEDPRLFGFDFDNPLAHAGPQ